MLRLKGKLVVYTVKAILTMMVVLVPLLGFWFSSSLAAYLDGPMWLVILTGLLFFPIIPLLWDWRATVKWRQKHQSDDEAQPDAAFEPTADELAISEDKGDGPQRILSFWDRLILRTLAVNLAFLIGLGWMFADEGFTAVSTRGDWMVDGIEAEWSEPIGEFFLSAAEGLEFLYHAGHDNPYREYADDDLVEPDDDARGDLRDRLSEEEDDDPDVEPDDDLGQGPMSWPPPDTLHPVIEEMPEEKETSIESVATYIADNEPDPFWRVKALFDYVTDRITYDIDALDAIRTGSGDRPPQDAQTVFETGYAVCAGYARLMIALGEYTGDELVYITGVSREEDGEISGTGHAWNAARIDDHWYLIDPTWGAGHVDPDEGFVRQYNPTYLFTPPDVFIHTHFPDEDGWQLLEEPISRGEFVRQPQLRPAFFSHGMELIEPTRSQTSVGSEARILVDNPNGHYMRATLVSEDGASSENCDVTDGDEITLRCPVPSSNQYRVQLFGGTEPYGTMKLWGRLQVQGS